MSILTHGCARWHGCASTFLLFFLLIMFTVALLSLASPSPSVPLGNAARPGAGYPVIGLGTSGYGSPDAPEPECWLVPSPQTHEIIIVCASFVNVLREKNCIESAEE